MTMKSLAAFAVLSLALAATPASAQKRSLADRVAALEAQQSSEGNAAGQQNIEMVNRLTQLQSEVQALRAQVESLQNENEQLKQRGKDQYLDLDTRLQRVEGSGAGAASAAAPAASTPAPVRPSSGAAMNAPRPASGANGDDAYAAAFQALKNENFVESARAFQAYLRDYPNGSLAPNAWYWLGESYYVTQNYPLALQAFDTVVTRFPDSNKAPDALLKKGFTQLELGQTGPGSATLNAVVNQFPDSEAARMATTRLRILAH
jgi:tol-pal system protein YbgF